MHRIIFFENILKGEMPFKMHKIVFFSQKIIEIFFFAYPV